MILAQLPTAPIPSDPMAGWISVVIQGGAFALVVYIVVVLYPKMTAASAEERTRRDDRFFDLVEALQAKFEARNGVIVTAVEKQTGQIGLALGQNADRIERAVGAACRHKG